jgi:galactose-1-phosphate uridylyltransferase
MPRHRSRENIKYLAGSELGSGVFINDGPPEERAKELRDL